MSSQTNVAVPQKNSVPLKGYRSESVSNVTTFSPSIIAIICVFSALCTVGFFMLLFCKKNPSRTEQNTPAEPSTHIETQRDNGMDPTDVTMLPMFSFLSLRNRIGLECAVCLNKYEDNQLLRLLPSCEHAFHVDCIDKWLRSHPACPLCRHHVSAEDATTVGAVLAVRNSNDELSERSSSSRRSTAIGDLPLEIYVQAEEDTRNTLSTGRLLLVGSPRPRFQQETRV
ncbi:hypothetical protein O6H91_13G053300 [Diphasiastrum complanatum]|uniref:Uncharacterized protein n=1 Tax=Diphasiastrum complanatum TaxID=34168 RepID=A0ACC2BUR0_DIPCM|nr:hypothetical protein O6H91_13G053300 [Diphasiastrum complanatum]